MDRYLFCVTETRPPAEVQAEETGEERREREAARLDVAPARPGDDPPTCGDEGGGSPYPEPYPGELPATRRLSFLQRITLRLRASASPSARRPP